MSGAEVFDALLTGLTSVLAWPAIGFMVLGVTIGMWMGAVPGLGGVLGMILLLPFTFDMEPVNAFALLLGLFAVTSTSDTIASVMLGIPGTAASQATILDGYPLAQRGQAARAFGAAFTVSAFGGVFGAAVLAISLPLITPIITAFKSGEIFMLAILGLAMVGSLSGGSITKGVAAALLGLLISTIGSAQTVAIYRYTFDQDYLLDGLPIVPVVLGLFAIPELMELATRNVNISRVSKEQAEGGGMLDGIRDAFEGTGGWQHAAPQLVLISVYCPGLAQLLWTGWLMGMRFNLPKTRVSLARAIFAALLRQRLLIMRLKAALLFRLSRLAFRAVSVWPFFWAHFCLSVCFRDQTC